MIPEFFMRAETRLVYEVATAETKLLIYFYVKDGWDYYWPYADRPQWLWDRYARLSLTDPAPAPPAVTPTAAGPAPVAPGAPCDTADPPARDGC